MVIFTRPQELKIQVTRRQRLDRSVETSPARQKNVAVSALMITKHKTLVLPVTVTELSTPMGCPLPTNHWFNSIQINVFLCLPMPLSFSSMLCSNSVAMCSNLNPDFFSQKFGLISLKFLLSPNMSLSSSSRLTEKGKGTEEERLARGF